MTVVVTVTIRIDRTDVNVNSDSQQWLHSRTREEQKEILLYAARALEAASENEPLPRASGGVVLG